jgi:flagellar biosynthesis GTPase FlhF
MVVCSHCYSEVEKEKLMEDIRRINFDDPDRMRVQEDVCRAVERDPEKFLSAYRNHPESVGGRYVCADLFKEMFPEYAQSKATRSKYNAAVHNSAAVLASECLTRLLSSTIVSDRDEVLFLTGIPGAGKTTSILGTAVDEQTRNLKYPYFAVYEGQMAKAESVLLRQSLFCQS